MGIKINKAEIFTEAEAAEALHTTKARIIELIKAGKLRAKRESNNYLILGENILAYLQRSGPLDFYIPDLTGLEDE